MKLNLSGYRFGRVLFDFFGVDFLQGGLIESFHQGAAARMAEDGIDCRNKYLISSCERRWASNAKYAEAEVALQTDSTSQPPTLNEAFQLPTLHSVVKYLSNTCCVTRKAGLFLGSLLVTNKKASKQANKQTTNKQTCARRNQAITTCLHFLHQ